jgi:colanic acid/amylovoran biosynthesis glycosyltransferase
MRGGVTNSRAPRGRLLMVVNRFPKFSETFIVNKLLALHNRGWDVHVACNRSDADQWELFPVLAAREEIRRSVHVARDLPRLVRVLRPELVHFEFGNLARDHIGSVAALGPRLVTSFRGPDLNFIGLDDPDFYADVWAYTDGVHVLGQDLWRRALQRGCPPEKPHFFIPPALRPEIFEADPRAHTERRGTLRKPLRILSVGRLHWMKGHEHALQAVRLLRDSGIAFEHRIVGGSDYSEADRSVRFAVQDLGLEDSVTLLGPRRREEVQELMRWADVFLHAAVSEGFCNAVIEAQAMGLPVVCTDADGLAENVANGQTGYVVPRRDPAALAEAMRRLARAFAVRRRIGAAGRSRAETQFRSDAQMDRFEQLYHGVLAAPPSDRAAAVGRLHRELELTEREQDAVEAEMRRVKRELIRLEEMRRLGDLVESAVPGTASLAVVSRGDSELLELGERRGCHFPQTASGAYAGHHPADSEEAVRHLEALRRRGVDFLVFPATALWWLDHYDGFRQHLDRRYGRVADEDGAGTIYALRAKPARAGGPRRRRRKVAAPHGRERPERPTS